MSFDRKGTFHEQGLRMLIFNRYCLMFLISNVHYTSSLKTGNTALNPDTVSLLTILKFRRKKDDFSFDKHEEHLSISKFVEYVAKSETGRKWKDVMFVLNNGVLKACIR